MADQFNYDNTSIIGPALNAIAVTPHDSTNLANVTRCLYVGTGGNVVVVFPGGAVITFSNVPDGTFMPVRALRVNSTSTTASNIVALW